jgi:AcrR family transcriptional regulator
MTIPRKQRPAGETQKSRNLEDLIRQFILDKSEELFIAGGYQKTSMDMIALECGLSKPTLYTYFHGKHEIFTRLYQRLHEGLAQKLKIHLDQRGKGTGALLAVIDEYFQWLGSNRDFLRMYFREQHVVIHEDIEEHMAWHVKSKKDMVDLLSQALEAILKPGVRKKYGADAVASLIFSMFEGFLADPLAYDEDRLLAQKKLMIELLREGVLAEKA